MSTKIIPQYHPAIIARFWRKVHKTDTCWLWTHAKRARGYGHFYAGVTAGHVYAHRFAYELVHGLIPAGLVIRHNCDVPACVNPAHLIAGTQRDNTHDRDRQGHGVRIVTLEQGEAIIRRYRAGETQVALGKAYGVSHTTISGIVRGKTWPPAYLSTQEATR